MSVAGCDYSSKFVDIVLLDENSDAAEWHRFELTGQDAFDRARSVRAAMPGSSFWDSVSAVGIEQPRGHHGIVHIARVQGAVLACIPTSKLVQPWNPSSWRKAVGLPGHATKDAISHYVIARRLSHAAGGTLVRSVSLQGWPQDACDAYCIALATRSLLETKEAA